MTAAEARQPPSRRGRCISGPFPSLFRVFYGPFTGPFQVFFRALVFPGRKQIDRLYDHSFGTYLTTYLTNRLSPGGRRPLSCAEAATSWAKASGQISGQIVSKSGRISGQKVVESLARARVFPIFYANYLPLAIFHKRLYAHTHTPDIYVYMDNIYIYIYIYIYI